MPSSGSAAASARIAVDAFIGSASSGLLGRRAAARGAVAVRRVADGLEQRAQRQRRVGDDRVAHRRARRLVGVARDRDERACPRAAAGRGCSGSRGRPTSPRRARGRAPASVSASGPIAGGRMPWKRGWSSGKPIRPPPGAGVAQTGSRWRSASATAASQPPLASMSGPATSTGFDACAQALGERAIDVRRRRARGRRPRASVWWRDRVVVDLGVPVVHRDRDERRALRRQRREVRGARERVRDVLGARRLVAPLDERVRHPRRVAVGQVGLQRHQRAGLLAGGDDERRLVGLRVEDRAHRVADAGRGVQVHERRPAASPARSRRPCRRRPPPGGRGRSGSRRGSPRASAARSSPGCRTSSSSRARAASRRRRREPASSRRSLCDDSRAVITGVHAIVYTKEAERLRAFFADVLELAVGRRGRRLAHLRAAAGRARRAPGRGQRAATSCTSCATTSRRPSPSSRPRASSWPARSRDEGFGLLTAIRLPDGTELGLYEPRHPLPPLSASGATVRSGGGRAWSGAGRRRRPAAARRWSRGPLARGEALARVSS